MQIVRGVYIVFAVVVCPLLAWNLAVEATNRGLGWRGCVILLFGVPVIGAVLAAPCFVGGVAKRGSALPELFSGDVDPRRRSRLRHAFDAIARARRAKQGTPLGDFQNLPTLRRVSDRTGRWCVPRIRPVVLLGLAGDHLFRFEVGGVVDGEQ
jgi:hypothetical protein